MNKKRFIVSIKPKFVEKIFSGEKLVELRKQFPIDVPTNSLILIYSSSPVKSFIGYIYIKKVKKMSVRSIWKTYREVSCINREEFNDYYSGKNFGYVIELTSPKKLKKPIDLSLLRSNFNFTPPQSFCYMPETYSLKNSELIIAQ